MGIEFIEDETIVKSEVKGDRGKRRKQDYTKAVSKRHKDISRGEMFVEHPWYDNLHQYSKNKIHCSCPLCAFNAKKHGRVLFGRILPMGDKKREDKLLSQLEEYRKIS